jgi:hypothetical protein
MSLVRNLTLTKYIKRLQQRALWVLELVSETRHGLPVGTAWSLWKEDSRFTLSCLSLAYTASVATQVSNRLEADEASGHLSIAVDASHQRRAAMVDLVDCLRTLCLEDADPSQPPAPMVQLSAAKLKSLRVHIREIVIKASAAQWDRIYYK